MISATRFPAQAGSHTKSSAAARKNPHHLANPGELIMTLPRRFIVREPTYQNPAAGLVSRITNRDLDRSDDGTCYIGIRRPAWGSPFAIRFFRFKMARLPKIRRGGEQCAALSLTASANWN